MSASSATLNALIPANRLALAYAGGNVRERLIGLLALDGRLAAIIRNSHEPMLAQLRLAWWREQLSGDRSQVSRGEPLLELLECWAEDRRLLAGLADGWEALTGAAPLPAAAFEVLADARARALAAMGGAGLSGEAALRMGRNWALADLAAHLSHPEERETVRALALRQNWTQSRLPRSLRPLAMLHALAARNLAAGQPVDALSATSVLTMVRIGLLGR